MLQLPAVLLGLALVLPAPASGDGVEEPAPPPVSAAPPPVARANEPGPCAAGAPLGQVVALTGAAHAQAPGEAPRALACDDRLRACDEVVTAPGASAGILAGDVLLRIGPDARVRVEGSEAAPELFVHRGSVRSSDARAPGAAPVRLTSRDLAASASGADCELETAAGGPSRLCAHAGSVAVQAGAASHTLAAQQCLASLLGDAPTFAAAGAPTLGVEAPGFCAFEVALADALAPGAVAAPGFGGFPDIGPAQDITRDPCDRPGSACAGAASEIPFDDPDPVPGCGAPGVVCGGGPGGD
jgi:hypothetical protein